MMPSGTYMSFDFGTKRMGLAVGQTVTCSASPLMTLSNTATMWPQIQTLIEQWQPKGLIIGLALQPDGSESKTSLLARQFGQALQQRFLVPIHYTEERLTSVEAQRLIREGRFDTRRHDKDSIAAVIILESWFNQITTDAPQYVSI
jgi:putative Holliday junction resolvase